MSFYEYLTYIENILDVYIPDEIEEAIYNYWKNGYTIDECVEYVSLMF